jgi:hypothetical protein
MGVDMNVRDFFDLPEEQRDMLVSLHRKQKLIRNSRDNIATERMQLATRELNNQRECEHPFSESTYKANENEFGNLMGSGTYHWYCEDCGKRWTTDR